MKVLLVVHDFLPGHAGGSEIYTGRLAAALGARGVEVSLLFTERREGSAQYEIRPGHYLGIPFHEVTYNHVFHDFEEMYDDPRMADAAGRVLDAIRPDVVHFQHIQFFGLGAVRAARGRGLPVVLTLHDFYLLCPRLGLYMKEDGWLCDRRTARDCAGCMEVFPLIEAKYARDRLEAPTRLDLFERAVERRIQRMHAIAPMVDLFTSPSRFLRQVMVRSGLPAERFLVTDNGFPKEGFGPPPKAPRREEKLRIGYVGGLTPWKGVHLLARAAGWLPADRCELEIWGETSWFPDYVEALSSLLEGTPGCLRGTYPSDRVAEVLRRFHVLVVPSLWYENSPMTIHEAKLAGLPVVATGHGGMAEFVQDGVDGLWFERGDAQDLARVLGRFLDEPALVERLRPDPAEVKSIEENAAEWEEIYGRLLAGRSLQPDAGDGR